MNRNDESQKALWINDGRVIDPGSGLDEEADILIEGGLIAEIRSRKGAKGSRPGRDMRTLSAAGKVVVPGLIDMHVHLREPGREDEETVASGAAAAVAGGFTGLACMPNTDPPLDTESAVRFVLRQAEKTPVHIYPVAAVTKGRQGKELTEIAALVEAGAVAVSDDGSPVSSPELMRRALEYTRMFDIAVISHAEETALTANGLMHEGKMSAVLGMRGMPSVAEELMVARDIALAEYTGGRLHVAHVSTARSVELIRQAKQRGLRVTAEVTPHHFTLTDEALVSYDANLKVNPPLRTVADVEALKVGLADGTIDAIASDHAPHAHEEKEVEFDAAPFGMIGLETTLGLVLSELVEPGFLSLSEAMAKMTIGPARILGIPDGQLAVGGSATMTIFDPDWLWTVDVNLFRSQSRNSPFVGREMRGRVEIVIVGGAPVFGGERIDLHKTQA